MPSNSKEYQQQYYLLNKDSKKEYQRNYYLLHKEEHKKKVRERYWANPEAKKAYDKEYRATHVTERNAASKRWLKTHRGCHTNYTDDWEHVEGYDRLLAAGLTPFNMTKQWVVHHKLEDYGFTQKKLKEINMYLHRPANELIIMTASEHTKHHANLRKQRR